ncbi:MAG: hypothetical protein ACR2GH_22800 [Pseudonocardia sp.]
MMRRITVVGVAVPGLLLAGFGLVHPSFLAPSTATAWWQLHVLLIPIFPLLAVALWVLLRGERGVLAWVARIAAYGYATFYTALDVLAGIGAGIVTEVEQGGSQAALDLLALGDQLGAIGAWCFLLAGALTGVVLIRRAGAWAVPGTLVLVGAGIVFLGSHIYYPVGVFAMVAVAVGCALLAAARRPVNRVESVSREPVAQPTS